MSPMHVVGGDSRLYAENLSCAKRCQASTTSHDGNSHKMSQDQGRLTYASQGKTVDPVYVTPANVGSTEAAGVAEEVRKYDKSVRVLRRQTVKTSP